MYTLYDAFNDRSISRHKTLGAAMRASVNFDRAVKRANGQNSYIPTVILENGKPVAENDEYYRALYAATYA